MPITITAAMASTAICGNEGSKGSTFLLRAGCPRCNSTPYRQNAPAELETR